MSDDLRERYLAELDELLPMPPERRGEVIEEISSHLDGAVANAMERGLSGDSAEEVAQARLGPPARLARELARADQSAWRLLAATGAGVRTGIGQGLYGYLVGGLALYLAFMISVGIGQLVRGWLEADWNLSMADHGWNTFLSAGAIAIGLYFAGRAVPATVSTTSRRMYGDVRRWVVGIVGALAFVVLVFIIEVPHNWASVVAWVMLPLAFAMGAHRPNLLPRRNTAPLALIIVAVLLVPLVGLAVAGGGSSSGQPMMIDEPFDGGISLVGPRWEAEHPVDGSLIASSGMSGGDGAKLYTWQVAAGFEQTGLDGLRAEAWRSDPPGAPHLDPGFDEPFAVAPVARDGDTLSAQLTTTDEPGILYWELILTGEGPDGKRYVLDSGIGEISTFTGTVWDWIAAVTD